MTFLEAIKICLKKCLVLRGRASRAEFGFFLVFCALGTISLFKISGVACAIFALVLLVPLLSASVRRLHDTGTSTYWLLLPLLCSAAVLSAVIALPRSYVLTVGPLVMPHAQLLSAGTVIIIASFSLVFSYCLRPGDPRDNEHGPGDAGNYLPQPGSKPWQKGPLP